MPSLPIFLAIVGVAVALVSMWMRANVAQVVAVVVALYMVLATLYWANSTTLLDGTKCHGAFGSGLMPSECLQRFKEAQTNVLLIWLIGIPAFIGFVIVARAEHQKKTS